ncbi:MAG: hypothetical protein R2741_06110 [Methanolobus sp.]
MDPQEAKKMKVRLEIIDDDGTESANVGCRKALEKTPAGIP